MEGSGRLGRHCYWHDRKVHLHWFRAPVVPMHLGLTDGPNVPHTLLSAQESPTTLTKYQMASGLKILISFGYMKRTRIYYPFLS
jgi:hypothetical protein